MNSPSSKVSFFHSLLFRSLADIVKGLSRNLSTETYDMVVRRSHVLQDGLRRAGRDHFNPSKRIKVICDP